MSRPMYETKSDLSNEQNAEKMLSAIFGCSLIKLPISYGVDWAAVSGKELHGFVEYKRRKFTWGQYATVMLSLLKYSKGISLIQKTNLKFKFVVEADNGIYATDLSESFSEYSFVYGGRTAQTRDPADIEPVVHIPISCFKKLA